MDARERRQRREDKRRRKAGKHYRTMDIGGGIEQAAPEAVLRALSRLPTDLDWPSVAESVIPILPRRRPQPLPDEPVRVTLPPGIPTGFGIDIGPAFLLVGAGLMAGWDIGPAELAAAGLENLRERLRPVRSRDLFRESLDGIPASVLQTGVGCASALLLAPDELERIFGPDPQCFIAPMRDLLISLPHDADRDLVAWLNEEFAARDPNGLALDAFVLEDGALRYEPLTSRLAAG